MTYSKKRATQPAGNDGKATVDTPSSRRSFRVRPLAIAAIVVILAVVAFLVVKRGTGSGERGMADKDKKVQRQRHARPTQPPPQVSQKPEAKEPEKPKREMYLGKEVVSHSFITNSTGRSVREVIVTADGKKHGKTTVIAKPTFKYGTDQMLADVLFPPEHGQLPPWPEMDAKAIDREFAQSILDPIEILDDDSEDVRIRKEAVRQARSEMIQLVKEGHSVLDVIRNQREGNEHAHDMQLTVARELHKMRREGASADAIKDYLDKANQLLEQSGIGPVAEPTRKGRRQ